MLLVPAPAQLLEPGEPLPPRLGEGGEPAAVDPDRVAGRAQLERRRSRSRPAASSSRSWLTSSTVFGVVAQLLPPASACRARRGSCPARRAAAPRRVRAAAPPAPAASAPRRTGCSPPATWPGRNRSRAPRRAAGVEGHLGVVPTGVGVVGQRLRVRAAGSARCRPPSAPARAGPPRRRRPAAAAGQREQQVAYGRGVADAADELAHHARARRCGRWCPWSGAGRPR